jgi:hypothetical protein
MSGYGSTTGQGSTGQTRDEVGQMADEVRHKAEDVKQQAQQKTAEVADQARESGRAMLEQQKGRAAQSLGSVASALRQAGDSLNNGEQAAFGDYASRAADKVDELAHQLQDKSMDEILYGAERFARREPEVFLGGAVLLGLLAARFLKASGARRSSMRDYEYGSQSYTRYGYGAQGAGWSGNESERYGSRGQWGGQSGSSPYRSGEGYTPSGEEHGRGQTGSVSSGYTRPASGYTQSGGGSGQQTRRSNDTTTDESR